MNTALYNASDVPPDRVEAWIEEHGGEVVRTREQEFISGPAQTQYTVEVDGETWILAPVSAAARQRQADAGRSLPFFKWVKVP